MADKLRVTQTRSTISHIHRNRATIRALGLGRIGDTVEVADNPATRGMVRQVRFLVSVEEIGEGKRDGKGAARGKTGAAEPGDAASADETAATEGAGEEVT